MRCALQPKAVPAPQNAVMLPADPERPRAPPALPDRVEFTFFADEPSQVLAIQAGQVDIINYSPQGGQALLNAPAFRILRIGSSAHTQVHLGTDQGPFQDKRIRQALALSLNRDGLVKGLLLGHGVVGNDSPFSPLFPSTDTAVPQRKQDIAKAKELLAAAGVPNGFKAKLTTEKYLEIPDYAVLIQNAARQIGIAIDLKIEDQGAYYGKATFGQSDWLDSVLGITDYGHRGTPNAVLNASFRSTGAWNSAHFKNPDYDRLLADYSSAIDLPAQRAAAGKLQAFLLEETPIIISYFSDSQKVTTAALNGVRYTAISQLYFDQASFRFTTLPLDRQNSSGSDGTDHRINSLFSRLQYNYDEKYLLTALIEPPHRLIYLTSGMHQGGNADLGDLQWRQRPWSGYQAYADSKLFDVVLAFAVAGLTLTGLRIALPDLVADVTLASTIATISTPLSNAQMRAISARSDAPTTATRWNPQLRAKAKISAHSARACRKNENEKPRYSTVSRDFSAKPWGVR